MIRRRQRQWQRRIWVICAGLVASVAVASAAQAQSQSSDTFESLSLFNTVLERIKSQYVEDVSEKRLIHAAIRGMLSDLGPHSAYLDPEAFESMQVQTQGEFGGLGIEVTMEEGVVKVVSPIEGTPADRAGLQPGDLITHINGEGIAGMSLNQAVEKMRGKVGSDITLTVVRGDREPFDVTITRATIEITSVRSRVIDKVGYIRITTFNEQTTPGVKDAIQAFQENDKDLSGIVLDLRNNPGGLLEQAVRVSDIFLEQGQIVSTRGRTDESVQRYSADSGDAGEAFRVMVLVNGGSASASEIVAGAIQDHQRGLIVGTPSFGKGSVQTVIPLPDDGAMRLTTARYYTPSGRSIAEKGVTPDIEIAQGEFNRAANQGGPRNGSGQGQTESANEGGGKRGGNGKQDSSQDEAVLTENDYQLARALTLMRGINLFTRRDGQE